MTADQWVLAPAARELADLYLTLDALKYAPPAPPEIITTGTSYGPADPCNGGALSVDVELVTRLFEVTRDAANNIDPEIILEHNGARLAGWIEWNAGRVADLDFAADILDELDAQTRRIRDYLERHGHGPEPEPDERPQTARSICHRLALKGHAVTSDLLRKWAERGHVTRVTLPDGHGGYFMSDVAEHINRKATTHE